MLVVGRLVPTAKGIGNATRRAFVDFGLEAGAAEELLSHVTHPPRNTMRSAYGQRPWKQLCEAIRAIEIRRHVVAETVDEPDGTGPRRGLPPSVVRCVVPGAATAPEGAAKRYESLLNSRRASGARRGTRTSAKSRPHPAGRRIAHFSRLRKTLSMAEVG